MPPLLVFSKEKRSGATDLAEGWPRGTTPHPRSGPVAKSARLCDSTEAA